MKLIKARLVDAAELDRLDKAGECDEAALVAALCQCKDGKQLAEALASLDGGGLPGRGGISRGRGDAAMTWSQGVKKDDAAFKEKVLPPAAVASLKESRLAGVSVGDPTSQKPGGGSAGGALGGGRRPAAGRLTPKSSFPNTRRRFGDTSDREKK